ncbi:molybdopterin molybdotransferase MoeA [soil metagenome]
MTLHGTMRFGKLAQKPKGFPLHMTGRIGPLDTDLDRLLQPAEALEITLQHTRQLPVEAVALANASWRVLGEDITAPEDHPPFPASTMDGFAVVADDPSPWREIIGDQPAGIIFDAKVTHGTAVRIMTGAPVPHGANAVVRVENTELADDHVIIHQESVSLGENIRPVASDVSKGALLLTTGTPLGPAEIGILASMGFQSVSVSRKPRVSIISTGDELAPTGSQLGPGQIRDSNRPGLVVAIEAAGAEVIWQGQAPDQRNMLERLLNERVDQSDIVVTSGGVSMGELDFVKAILPGISRVHFRRVFLKPGKPLNFATSGDTLIFGLPGNPVSALVSFELFLGPAIRKMQGLAKWSRPQVVVKIEHAIQATDRIEYQRALIAQSPTGTLTASVRGSQASSRLTSFVGTNGLLVVPPRNSPYQPGDQLTALLTGQITDSS